MAINYRRPGVYLEETLLSGPNDVGSANSVALFVGAAVRGPSDGPVRCDSWSDYVSRFGNFEAPPGALVSYLPYAVYSFFQNGGRVAYVQRAVGTAGTAASYDVIGEEVEGDAPVAFTVSAISAGEWGDNLSVQVSHQQTTEGGAALVYTLSVFIKDEVGNRNEIERFTNLSLTGNIPGTKRVDTAINDEIYGSRYVRVSNVDTTVEPTQDNDSTTALLSGGVDGGLPSAANLLTAAETGVNGIEGPIILNIVGYQEDGGDYVLNAPSPSTFADRGDVFIINDAAAPRAAGTSGASYATALEGQPLVSAGTGSSYSASYTPWIVVPDPAKSGQTITIPPGGAVAGVYSRIDATEGIFRAPAGVIAGITNAINVDARFSNAVQGELNHKGINVIRPVAGSGIAIMGGRTRKRYGVDRYVSARRTLIYIKESLRISTQFAVFENNDELLWTRLRSTADNILRPIWSAGGLKGGNAAEAYYVVCDDSINTPAVIASGEVRMEVGVALQHPAEFIVIRVAQFDGGGSAEIQI